MKLTVRSPSNIALIKYWGKFGDQLPCNPSLSFTLSKAFTEMNFVLSPKSCEKLVDLDFLFEDKANEKFQYKIEKFLIKEKKYFENVLSHRIHIESMNTFPHSSGIASSASSMSALVYGLLTIEYKLMGKDLEQNHSEFLELASSLSRLASGSASRSIFSGVALWGQLPELQLGSDLYAIELKDFVDQKFLTFRDTIVIVSAEEKSVSSRAGHALMENHPYKDVRYQVARERINELLTAMKNYDLDTFIRIVETDALDLHGLMMTSNPSFLLIKAKTVECIEKLRFFREKTKIPVCFTLDAGPNLHVLYPAEFEKEVHEFLATFELPLIHDQVGMGTSITKPIEK